MKRFTLEDVAMLVQSMGGDESAMQEIVGVLRDPDMEEQGLLVMRQVFVGVKDKVLKKGLKEFRETGQTKLPAPISHENRPRFVAHRLNEDIFIDANCTELDRARVVMRKEWFTETELRDKILTEGFNEDFVEEVLEKTESVSGVAQYDHRTPIRFGANVEGRGAEGDFDDLYEIFMRTSESMILTLACQQFTALHSQRP